MTIPAVKKEPFHPGFTLLELIATISLMVVLVGLIWGIMAGFARRQVEGMRLSERSQLLRSLAQLLTDDLASAIQDPITPTKGRGGDDSIRRFGLVGTATSLQIDVVAINPFAPGAGTETPLIPQRQAELGGVTPDAPQAPELKTVYYDFQPLTASLQPPADPMTITQPDLFSGSDSNPETTSEVVDDLSDLDLPDSSGESAIQEFSAMPVVASIPKQPGLSRRELDFETPTSPELERFSTMVAPEVVACRFRYFDGSVWRNDWDSIANEGLPVAIEVVLRLMPLDEVATLRQSPLLARSGVSGAVRVGADSLSTDTFEGDFTMNFPVVGQGDEASDLPEPQLDAIVTTLGLSPLVSQRIVAYLPASPARQYKPYERIKPPVRQPKEPVSPPPVSSTSLPSAKPTNTPAPPPAPSRQWIRQ